MLHHMSHPNESFVRVDYCPMCGSAGKDCEPDAGKDAKTMLFVLWDAFRPNENNDCVPTDAWVMLARICGGFSLEAIAQRLGVTKAAVGLRCREMSRSMPGLKELFAKSAAWQRDERTRPSILRGIDAVTRRTG